MDPYKTLGVTKNATKEEIKQAFRRLAMEFHPDKHHSLKSKNSATHKFKLITEAYETLIDGRKRADYNLRRNAYGSNNDRGFGRKGTGYGDRGGNYGYGYGYSSGGYSAYGYGYGSRGGGAESAFVRFGMNFVKYLNTKSFLLHATFASILLGGTFAIDSAGETLWKMQNNGKSFEEALKSVERAKSRKDDDDDS